MPFYSTTDDLQTYVFTCFEERLHNYGPDETDDVEEYFLYFDDMKSFKMFLEEYCFMELDDGNLKSAIVNTCLNDDNLFNDISREVENYKECLAEQKAKKENEEKEESEESEESEEEDEN